MRLGAQYIKRRYKKPSKPSSGGKRRNGLCIKNPKTGRHTWYTAGEATKRNKAKAKVAK